MRKYFPVGGDLDGFNEFIPSDHIPVAGLPDAIRDQKSAWLNTISVRAVFSAEVEDGDLVVPVVRDETNDWYHPDTVWVPALGPDAVMHAETETGATYQPKFYGMAYKGINRVMLGPLVYHPTYKFRAGDILYATTNGKMTTEQTEVFVGACLAPGYVLLHGTAQNIDLFKKAAELTERAETAASTSVEMAEQVVEVGEAQIRRMEELAEQLLIIGVSYNKYAVADISVQTAEGTQIALPEYEGAQMSYIVGSNTLLLCCNGTWMLPGEQYTEVGTPGLPSAVIQLNQELRPGDKLGVLILSQYTKVLLSVDSGLGFKENGELYIAPVTAEGTEDTRTLPEWAAAIHALEQPVIAEGSTTARPLTERFADITNVKDFGAVGDGAADDTAAFVAAAVTGKNVFVPDGTFILSPSASNLISALQACRLLTGTGKVEIILPAGLYSVESFLFECKGDVEVRIRGEVEVVSVNGNLTFSGEPGLYTATLTVPDGSLFSVGMPISLRQTSEYSTIRCIIGGTVRISAISGNDISFPAHFHAGAYAPSNTTWAGTVTLYKTAFQSDNDDAVFSVQGNCKTFEVRDLAFIGPHSYGASFPSSKGVELKASAMLVQIGATEFGRGVFIDKAEAFLESVFVANCDYGIRAQNFSKVICNNTIVSCLCSADGFFIDHACDVFSSATSLLNGNGKRGLWCYGGSTYFSEAVHYTNYNKVAGVYAKANASVYVGQNSVSSYNYETDANDCPGYGCESDSFIMAYGTQASYNGIGYSPGNGAVIDAQYATALDNVNTNFYALTGGVIEAAHSAAGGSPYGYSAAEGAVIRCKNAEVYGATTAGLAAARCSEIRADNISIHDNAVGLKTANLADIYAPGATLVNNGVAHQSGRNSVIYAGSSLYPTYFTPGEGELFPWTDNAQRLGLAGQRWSNVFAATGSVQTSDRRSKTSVTDPSEALMRAWGRVNFKAFQFVDALEKKGEDARIHVGVIAQDVQEAFAEEGLDASRYGLFCFDQWDDIYVTVTLEDGTETKTLLRKAGSLYGIRYDEALALECAYQRWLNEKREQRLARLEALMGVTNG